MQISWNGKWLIFCPQMFKFSSSFEQEACRVCILTCSIICRGSSWNRCWFSVKKLKFPWNFAHFFLSEKIEISCFHQLLGLSYMIQKHFKCWSKCCIACLDIIIISWVTCSNILEIYFYSKADFEVPSYLNPKEKVLSWVKH